jgi:HEAT repeat protein
MAVAVVRRTERHLPLQESRTDWAAELADERTWMRRRAAFALSKMPHFARSVPEALRAAARDRDAQTRRWAALALERAQLDQGFCLPERS